MRVPGCVALCYLRTLKEKALHAHTAAAAATTNICVFMEPWPVVLGLLACLCFKARAMLGGVIGCEFAFVRSFGFSNSEFFFDRNRL